MKLFKEDNLNTEGCSQVFNITIGAAIGAFIIRLNILF
jgi:hypothetical protein